MAEPTPLQKFFAGIWDFVIEGVSTDTMDIEDLILKHGLGEWKVATAIDVEASPSAEFDVGDSVLCLTEAGADAVRAVRGSTE